MIGGKDREEMNDLISRKEAIELLRKNMINDIQDQITTENNINLIESLPTAFDTEKVVEQLEETKRTALNKVKMPIMIVCKHDLQEFADICFEEAIDIVKKGGVE